MLNMDSKKRINFIQMITDYYTLYLIKDLASKDYEFNKIFEKTRKIVIKSIAEYLLQICFGEFRYISNKDKFLLFRGIIVLVNSKDKVIKKIIQQAFSREYLYDHIDELNPIQALEVMIYVYDKLHYYWNSSYGNQKYGKLANLALQVYKNQLNYSIIDCEKYIFAVHNSGLAFNKYNNYTFDFVYDNLEANYYLSLLRNYHLFNEIQEFKIKKGFKLPISKVVYNILQRYSFVQELPLEYFQPLPNINFKPIKFTKNCKLMIQIYELGSYFLDDIELLKDFKSQPFNYDNFDDSDYTDITEIDIETYFDSPNNDDYDEDYDNDYDDYDDSENNNNYDNFENEDNSLFNYSLNPRNYYSSRINY